MDCNNLDEEFDEVMADIRHNLSFLENDLDMMTISCWVTRLSQPTYNIEDKLRRNEYVTYLSYMLKREMIHQPFVDEPPDGPLPPLNISLESSVHTSKSDFGAPARRINTLERTILSDLNSSQIRGPIAISTPKRLNSMSNDTSVNKPSTKTKTSKLTKIPCKPCERLLEQPGKNVAGKPSPCPKRVCPDSSPPGYLDFTAKVDNKPFIPPLPGSEDANLKMEIILESVDNCTRLLDFIGHIGPTTIDQGQFLNYTATAELSQFQEFVQSMYKTRMQDTEELLGKKQMSLKKRYDDWEEAEVRRTQTALSEFKCLVPGFKYASYQKNPDYIYNKLRTLFKVDEQESHPQIRVLRIKAQKNRWLAEESERIERENQDRLIELKKLNDQLNSLSKCYNSEHKGFMNRNKCLEQKAAQLRIRFQQNQKLIGEQNTQPCNY